MGRFAVAQLLPKVYLVKPWAFQSSFPNTLQPLCSIPNCWSHLFSFFPGKLFISILGCNPYPTPTLTDRDVRQSNNKNPHHFHFQTWVLAELMRLTVALYLNWENTQTDGGEEDHAARELWKCFSEVKKKKNSFGLKTWLYTHEFNHSCHLLSIRRLPT